MITNKLARVERLQVWTPQGHAGLLSKNGQHVFNYAPGVLDEGEAARAIALTMPLQDASYQSTPMLPVFQTFLPEGFLAERIAERFGKTMRIDDMALLALSGASSIGRLQMSGSADEVPKPGMPESLGELLADQGSRDLFEYLCDRYLIGSGISGVQPKVMLAAQDIDDGNSDSDRVPDARRSHGLPRSIGERATLRTRNVIVKVGGGDYPGLAENEFHCMSIARRAGLAPPPFWLSDDGKRFVIERFDVDAHSGVFSGFEDMVALQGKVNARKYEGAYELIAVAIQKNCSPSHVMPSLSALFATIVLSVVVRNGDAHLKNFGLLYEHPASDDCRLSPLYDIVCTTAYIEKDRLALSLAKERGWPSRATLSHFGRSVCLVAQPEAVIDEIVEAACSYAPEHRGSDIWPLMKKQIDAAAWQLQKHAI